MLFTWYTSLSSLSTPIYQDSDDDDSDDSSNWDSDSSSDSSSDDDSAVADGTSELKGRARWLKRTTVVKEKVEKDKQGRSEERKKAKEEAAKLRAAQAEQREKDQMKEEDLTPSLVQKKSLEIVSSRGRKGSDPKVLLGQLEALSKLAVRFGPRVEIPVLMHVITAQFDMQRTIDDYMETPMWRSCASYIERIGEILNNGEGWKIGATTGEDEELANDMMMSTMMGGKSRKGKKMKASMAGLEGAMSAMASEEKLINPNTVSLV